MSHPSNPVKLAQINHSGASYFLKGFQLIQQKGVRRFVFIPLAINVLLFSFAFYFVYLELTNYMESLMAWLPNWLDWLNVILWPLALITVLVIFFFCFQYRCQLASGSL